MKSKKETNQKGPLIHLDIHVGKDGIFSSSIHPFKEEFSWEIQGEKKWNQAINNWMEAYKNKIPQSIDFPLDLKNLPPFTYKILQNLINIQFGETCGYQELAILVKNPLAARAVGNACARNPIPLIIPCHRILGKNSLGGFSGGGIKVKEELLQFETSKLIKF